MNNAPRYLSPAAQRIRALALGTSSALVVLPAAGAHAQSVLAHDPAAAQTLFEDGKRLFGLHRYSEACPDLAESQRLDPAGGTVLLLALCHEQEGKTATAWAEFNEAQSSARREKRADREALATEHIAALEPRLLKIRVRVSPRGEEVTVRRDGLPVGKAQWSTPIPVDPGPHAIEASAQGRKTWKTAVTATAEGQVTDVSVPILEAEPVVAARVSVVAPAPPARSLPETAADEEVSKRRFRAFVVGAAGIVSSGIGVGFGLSASSKWKSAEIACPNMRCRSSAGITAGQDAGRAADVSTVFLSVGAVALATSVVLFLTASSGPSASSETREAIRVVPLLDRGTAGFGIGGAL